MILLLSECRLENSGGEGTGGDGAVLRGRDGRRPPDDRDAAGRGPGAEPGRARHGRTGRRGGDHRGVGPRRPIVVLRVASLIPTTATAIV